MTSIKGHFDGSTVVLDEPATLKVGQLVRVLIDPATEAANADTTRPSLRGIAKGTFAMSDDFNDPLDDFAEYRK